MSAAIPHSGNTPFEDSMLDSCAATDTAVVDADEAGIECPEADREWTGARCEKCDARLVSDVVSICRHCGWYGSLGQFVEVDPDWEVAAEPAAATTEPAPRPSHLQTWIQLLPRWSWVVIASVLALIVESVVARFAVADNARTTWSICQLTIGLLAAVGCHIYNFLVLSAEDADVGMLDLLMRPVRLWVRAVQQLPTRLWAFDGMISGLAAALLSVLVIGALPYERLLDWGFKEPPKRDLMGAVMDQAKKFDNGEGDGDLEKSINDFAGKEGPQEDDKPKKEAAKPKQSADCVILGFQLDRDAHVTLLVLGAVNGGKLVYAGSVRPALSEEEAKELSETLQAIEAPRPIIKVDYSARWVQPTLTCRVKFRERSKSGQLRDMEWSKLLGNISH